MKSMRPPLFRSPRVGVSSRVAAAAFCGAAVWVTFCGEPTIDIRKRSLPLTATIVPHR